MASCLPDHTSLERLRKDARRLQRAVAAGDAHALELVRRLHPKTDVPAFRLADAQLTVARAYGLSGWPALVRYLDVAAGLSPVRWRDFALGTFLGTLPSIAVPTAFAAGLARGADGAHTEALLWLVAGGAGVLWMALLTRRFARASPPAA